jgi:hypothetical protein
MAKALPLQRFIGLRAANAYDQNLHTADQASIFMLTTPLKIWFSKRKAAV